MSTSSKCSCSQNFSQLISLSLISKHLHLCKPSVMRIHPKAQRSKTGSCEHTRGPPLWLICHSCKHTLCCHLVCLAPCAPWCLIACLCKPKRCSQVQQLLYVQWRQRQPQHAQHQGAQGGHDAHHKHSLAKPASTQHTQTQSTMSADEQCFFTSANACRVQVHGRHVP